MERCRRAVSCTAFALGRRRSAARQLRARVRFSARRGAAKDDLDVDRQWGRVGDVKLRLCLPQLSTGNDLHLLQ